MSVYPWRFFRFRARARTMPEKGINIPKMSMADALFTRTQQRVLGFVFGQPDRDYGTVELIRLAGSGSGAVQRALERLTTSGLITCTRHGQQKRYRANRDSPLFEELRTIVEKTAGVPQVLQAALAPLAPRRALAILYGSRQARRPRNERHRCAGRFRRAHARGALRRARECRTPARAPGEPDALRGRRVS